LKPIQCTITLNDPDKYRICELFLPIFPDDLAQTLADMDMADESAINRCVVSFEYMSPELDALFLRIPRGTSPMEINKLAMALEEMEDGVRREYVKTILDWCPISMDEMLYHANRASSWLSGMEQGNNAHKNPPPPIDHTQREQLHADLMDKVLRDFNEVFDDWYDRMGIIEGGVLLADCSRIMKELRTDPPSDDAMRYLMRYEQPLQLILSYWEGEKGSYCRDDFTQAIDRLMENGMEDNFALDPAYAPQPPPGIGMETDNAEDKCYLKDMTSEALYEKLLGKLRLEHAAYMENWFAQDRQEMENTLLNAADRTRILREIEREQPYDEQMRCLLQYKTPQALILSYWVGYFSAYRPEDMDSILNNLLENGAGGNYELDPSYLPDSEGPSMTDPT